MSIEVSRADSYRLFIGIALVVSSLKLLLLPTYRSTDFEVHRNWMAITHSIPLKEWYFEKTSEWTLDYPPFFAYFEYILSCVAYYVDPHMLEITNLNYAETSVIVFQRSSVIVVDTLLVYFTWCLLVEHKPTSLDSCRGEYDRTVMTTSAAPLGRFFLVVFNVGLLLVDHIHFQYNGVLVGLLIATIYFAQQKKYWALTFTFSVLVLMKHLFVPLAPIFGVYLLVETSKIGGVRSVFNLFGMLIIALFCLAVAFGPFYMQENGIDQMIQIFQRLFPFGRGLVHAYWAPNIWALYCFVDKFGGLVLRKIGYIESQVSVSGFNSTSGLVGDFAMTIFPKVTATHCLGLVLLTSIPAIIAVSKNQSLKVLIRSLAYASMCSFLFGYHVHEKAIIIPWILMSLYADSVLEKFSLMLLSTAGIVSLFPLIPGKFELLIKGGLLLVSIPSHWLVLNVQSFPSLLKSSLYCAITALVGTALYSEAHATLFVHSDGNIMLPFLPLMVTSIVCAVVNVVCWSMSLFQMYQLCKR